MKNIQEAKRYKLRDNVSEFLNTIVDTFFERIKKPVKNKTLLGVVSIKTEDGNEGYVRVYIDPFLDKEFKDPVLAYLDVEGEESDPENLYVSINPKEVKDRTELYNTLYHEFLHATDPVFTTKSTEKFWDTYDPNVDEKYWGHQIEFRAITGEILNAMVNEFKKRKSGLTDKSQLKYLLDSNYNILHHFSQGEELTNLSKKIFQSMFKEQGLKSVLSKISIDYPSTTEIIPSSDKDMNYLTRYLMNVKKFSGKKWNRFLSMLYSTHQEIMDLLTED